ncbi:hypothetical protein G6O67_004187 [Ophiocordyceps sinensis]|uniref:F-box domain-containing protein n=1 Tax=Ophiocordyceps sinensis TaxID=72228 RepID=A0A8H4LYC8_9HYPO|nr:hypothetical protein G6O67_004187 [Ophiocordyceps sinensis]
MDIPGLQVICFRGRYYNTYSPTNGSFDGLGTDIVESIPTDPGDYQEWLSSFRDLYASYELELERVFETFDGSEPAYDGSGPEENLASFVSSKLPRLDRYYTEYIYITNLDNEVLTINFSLHWKLGNIPRDNLWRRAIKPSIYQEILTLGLGVCPQEHMASPALVLREVVQRIGYRIEPVTPRMGLDDAPKVFTTRLLAGVIIEYTNEMIRFGREWSPDALPFRELTFALLSIASGQAKLHSFPTRRFRPCRCHTVPGCVLAHVPVSGWLGPEWAADEAPLMDFGSMAHRPGEPPGASPTATTYWLQGVLVSLELVVDGEAVTRAVAWGIQQGRTHFQIVVMSLFEVAFVEVLSSGDLVRVSHGFHLSPLKAEYCLSTHPRHRPEWRPGMEIEHYYGKHRFRPTFTGTARNLQTLFPGLAALVNFFDVAARRQAATKGEGRLPPELYRRIMDFVDYDTFKACSVVSPAFRSYSRKKHRVSDCTRVVAGPLVRLQRHGDKTEHLLTFHFENLHTGKIVYMVEVRRDCVREGPGCVPDNDPFRHPFEHNGQWRISHYPRTEAKLARPQNI